MLHLHFTVMNAAFNFYQNAILMELAMVGHWLSTVDASYLIPSI